MERTRAEERASEGAHDEGLRLWELAKTEAARRRRVKEDVIAALSMKTASALHSMVLGSRGPPAKTASNEAIASFLDPSVGNYPGVSDHGIQVRGGIKALKGLEWPLRDFLKGASLGNYPGVSGLYIRPRRLVLRPQRRLINCCLGVTSRGV